MTEPQRLALAAMIAVPYLTPAEIGYAISPDRPGGRVLKAQGAGRIGGSMASRLIKFGWAENCSHLHMGFPAYRITDVGRIAFNAK